MQFTSFEFAVFFPVVLLVFYILPKKLRTIWLLAASYYFYMAWDVRYLLLIVITLLVLILVCGVYGEGYDASEFIYFQF